MYSHIRLWLGLFEIYLNLYADISVPIISYNEVTSTPDQQLYLAFDDGAPGPTIACSADGHLPPTVEWIHQNGGQLQNGLSQSSQFNGQVLLQWQRPIEFTDSGVYACQASNNIGNSTADLELLVQSMTFVLKILG